MTPGTGTTVQKAEKSYLSSAVDSINPWASSRSATPVPTVKEDGRSAQPPSATGDHSLSHLYGISTRSYPPDCPPLKVQWFHFVDLPKRKPQYVKGRTKPDAGDAKPAAQPKKFVAFSASDSRSIEASYQRLLEQMETSRASKRSSRVASIGTKVPVNEDFLFDVDIEKRELAPVYWLGPVYEVRRGTWFYQEGSILRPCEENLAAQLEDGYLKIKPWLYATTRPRGNSGSKNLTPKASADNLRALASSANLAATAVQAPASNQPQTHRLFGSWMNQVATYQDATTARLQSEDSMLSWVTSTMYERFSGGSYMGGAKLVRGYSEPGKAKTDENRPSTPTEISSTEKPDEKQQRALKRRSAPPTNRSSDTGVGDVAQVSTGKSEVQPPQSRLERQLSSLLESSDSRNPGQKEEALRKLEENEIRDDYNAQDGESQGREIDHLILVTHGIGQLLGLKMESINFVHDVNTLRKTLKSVYSQSKDLRALNADLDDGPGNCRIQVLPVCWRHLLDFPKQREKKKEHDLGDAIDEEDEYPSLEDITIEGMAFARSLISDLALDVLLYQSAYRQQIAGIVLQESNRIHDLFLERNPNFKGKVHLVGHSLGSAIYFDILCRQREKSKESESLRDPLRFWPSPERPAPVKDPNQLDFNFDVEDFYCLGSPVGLFQMLKGRSIAARHTPHALPSESPLDMDDIEDPFLSVPAPGSTDRISPITGLPFSVSSPKVAQLYNIFHPSDPISYRLEPLITTAMRTLKPQLLPYTKKGMFAGVAPQGLSGIGMKVGQSVTQGVTGLWSSLSAGIASNLLNRSLGLSNEEVASMTASTSRRALERSASIHGNSTAKPNEGKRGFDDFSTDDQQATSGSELETLFSNFQKRKTDLSKVDKDNSEEVDWKEEERKSQKLKVEETKVRALNRTGRVDFSIQEGVLDFNPINTIASHMSYWADEDVNHFMLTRLLSKAGKQ